MGGVSRNQRNKRKQINERTSEDSVKGLRITTKLGSNRPSGSPRSSNCIRYFFSDIFKKDLFYTKHPVRGYLGRTQAGTQALTQCELTFAVIWNSSCSFSSSWVCWILEPVEVCVER